MASYIRESDMKIGIPLLAVLCVATGFAFNEQELFLRANEHYEKKEFDRALELYQLIKRRGPAVWYNMGNTYYQSGRYTDALVCWRQSEKNATRATLADIAYNIQVVKAKIGMSDNHRKLHSLLERMIRPWSLLFLQFVFLVLLYCLFFLVRRYKYGKRFSFKAFFLLIILTSVIGFLLLLKYKTMHQDLGVVRTAHTNLYTGPDTAYHVIGSMNEAAEVLVEEQREMWCKIKSGDTVGWIEADKITVI